MQVKDNQILKLKQKIMEGKVLSADCLPDSFASTKLLKLLINQNQRVQLFAEYIEEMDDNMETQL